MTEVAPGLCTLATLDFEASGLSQTSYPIEVGICFANATPLNWLINPLTADDWQHWDEAAEEIHRLRRVDLEQQGENVADVCQALNRYLGQFEVVLCDSEWDLFWLGRLYRAAHMRPSFTLLEINQWLTTKGLSSRAFQDQFHALGPARHRAAEDAVQIYSALAAMLNAQDVDLSP
ncbi:hypothetical protein [Thaumasiovibrio subtropicus]|uniref:hypothetical protein n=1 Tax=Thaumasiovibrio subtropicus TaxID=1891207 RepID=UPI000B351738|nr:hypothetical protein [Thaumasiovibrio subtropicus]